MALYRRWRRRSARNICFEQPEAGQKRIYGFDEKVVDEAVVTAVPAVGSDGVKQQEREGGLQSSVVDHSTQRYDELKNQLFKLATRLERIENSIEDFTN